MIFGAAFYSYMIGIMISLMTSTDEASEEMEYKKTTLKKFS